MAQRTLTQFKTLYGSSGTVFPDNTTGEISEADVRAFGEDIADSFSNIVTGPSIQTAKRTITSAEILTANSVPVLIIAAPGAGKIIRLLTSTIKYIYNSAAYTTNEDPIFTMGGVTIHSNMFGLLANTDTRWTFGEPVSGTETPTDLENEAVYFSVQTGNPASGNSSLIVSLSYVIEDLS